MLPWYGCGQARSRGAPVCRYVPIQYTPAMSPRIRWALLLSVACFLLAVIMQAPQWLRTQDPRYQGVPIDLNSDEGIYQARVEEALSGRPGQAGEAITGDPRLEGMQSALLERLIGQAFAGMGLHASDVFTIGDSVIPALLFLALWFFLRRSGFSRRMALLGALLFVAVEFYSLNRPLYQRTSTLLALLALLGIIAGLERHWLWAVAGGLLMGLLTSVYFWSWTFVWLWWGLLCLFVLLRRPRMQQVRVLGIAGASGVIGALPFVLTTLRQAGHPQMVDTLFRSALHPSWLPESWPYTILFFGMAAGALVAFVQDGARLRPYAYAVITILAGCFALNQSFIHGRVFEFTSHYLFLLVIAAVCSLLLALALRFRPRVLAACLLCPLIYLSALMGDQLISLRSQFSVRASDFAYQYLSGPLFLLHGMPRVRILSDSDTSQFIAAYTHHDVVYSIYLKDALMSSREIAHRYCLTVAAVPPANRHPELQKHLVWPDANRAYGEDVRRREVDLVTRACANIDRHMPLALRAFGVTHVLWDERMQPQWEIARLGVPLREVQSGSGWSLWELR